MGARQLGWLSFRHVRTLGPRQERRSCSLLRHKNELRHQHRLRDSDCDPRLMDVEGPVCGSRHRECSIAALRQGSARSSTCWDCSVQQGALDRDSMHNYASQTEWIREKLLSTHVVARKFNVTALFGGVGALEFGLASAGHRASSFCEIDPEAATVLRARFPGAAMARDIQRPKALSRRLAQSRTC